MSRYKLNSKSVPKAIDKLIPKVQDEIMKRKNVVGVGSGFKITNGVMTNEPCILIGVKKKIDKNKLGVDDLLPGAISNVRTDVIGIGEIMAGSPVNSSIQMLTQRVRPAMAGYSIGHYLITAGTIGTYVYDASSYPGMPQRYYILSNNHVLANSNDSKIGDPILQPGPLDGGEISTDTIARLSRFVSIKFKTATSTPLNLVDAAIAEVDISNGLRELYWIGDITGVNTERKIGDIVMKTGRTTNFTTGKILSTNYTTDVNYGDGKVARFYNQILTSAMSAGGDSGSLVVDINKKAVGLLFAGSTSATVINKIYHVENLLSIKVWP